MSRWDEDVEAKVAGPLKNFHAGAVGPLLALPIIRNGSIDGYLYAGVGDESGKAGVQGRLSGDFEPAGSRYWSGRLRELFEQGMPALEAVKSLRGAPGESGRGQAGSEMQRFASRQELIASLDPHRASRPDSPDSRARVARSDVDAVLRGEARPTPEIETAVRDLDAALSQQPTSEPLVVAQGRARATLPAVLEPGTRVDEPAYLLTFLTSDAAAAPVGEVLVTMKVPAGTPALFLPSELPIESGTLVLARGLSWRVLRVFEGVDRTLVTGEVVSS